jgi:hypothetical protein
MHTGGKCTRAERVTDAGAGLVQELSTGEPHGYLST